MRWDIGSGAKSKCLGGGTCKFKFSLVDTFDTSACLKSMFNIWYENYSIYMGNCTWVISMGSIRLPYDMYFVYTE